MTYTLVADGGSDRVLIPILTWSLMRPSRSRRPIAATTSDGVQSVTEQWADFSRIRPVQSLGDRLRVAFELYPCDVLFVHRDAENQPPLLRRQEIAEEIGAMAVRFVAVIPVRMTEAWLLFDEQAIRAAAGNPHGAVGLNLPELNRLETIADPKGILHKALKVASGRNARRRAALSVHQRVHRIPHHIENFSKLDILPAFRALQEDIQSAIAGLA